MNFDPEAQASELEKRLFSYDADYKANREKLVQAIQALRGVPAKAPEKLDPHANTRPLTNFTKALQTSLTEMSRAEAVDAALRDYPGKFTTPELKRYIVQKFPAIASQIKGSYLPTILMGRVKAGTVKLLEKGVDGRPNTWIKA